MCVCACVVCAVQSSTHATNIVDRDLQQFTRRHHCQVCTLPNYICYTLYSYSCVILYIKLTWGTYPEAYLKFRGLGSPLTIISPVMPPPPLRSANISSKLCTQNTVAKDNRHSRPSKLTVSTVIIHCAYSSPAGFICITTYQSIFSNTFIYSTLCVQVCVCVCVCVHASTQENFGRGRNGKSRVICQNFDTLNCIWHMH